MELNLPVTYRGLLIYYLRARSLPGFFAGPSSQFAVWVGPFSLPASWICELASALESHEEAPQAGLQMHGRLVTGSATPTCLPCIPGLQESGRLGSGRVSSRETSAGKAQDPRLARASPARPPGAQGGAGRAAQGPGRETQPLGEVGVTP